MARRFYKQLIPVEISDIVETTDRRIRVILKATGITVTLPRNLVDFKPGLAILPAWLAKKILAPKIPRRPAQ